MISNKIENDQFEENLSGIHQLVSSHTDILVKQTYRSTPGSRECPCLQGRNTRPRDWRPDNTS